MVDPSIRAVGTPAFANTTTNTALVPSTAVVGDLLLRVEVGGNNPLTGPAGWTLKSSLIEGATSQISHYVWQKTCVSGDIGAGVTVTSGTTNRKYGLVLAVRDAGLVDLSVPLGDSTTTVTTHPAASSTTSQRDFPILLVSDRASASVAPSPSFTYPSGYTGIHAGVTAATVNAGDVSLGIATHAAQATGTTAGGGNWIAANALSRAISTIITVPLASVTPPTTPDPQMFFNTGTGWKLYDVLGVGVTGSTLHEVTLHSFGSAAYQLAADFETGVIPSLFTQAISAVASNTNQDTGAYGALLTPNASGLTTLTIGTATWPAGQPWTAVRFRFKLNSLPGATEFYMNLCEIANDVPTSPKGQFTVYWNNRVLEADFNTGADATSLGLTASVGGWHTFEARVFFGATTYTAKIRIDGGTPIQMVSLADKTPATSTTMWFGYPAVISDYTRALDNIWFGTYPSDPGWITGPTGPAGILSGSASVALTAGVTTTGFAGTSPGGFGLAPFGTTPFGG